MECEQIKRQLSGYMDGILDSQTARIIETHLKECKGCNEEYLSLKALVAELRSLDNLTAPEEFVPRIHERIEAYSWFEKIRGFLFFPLRRKVPLELAALAATALLIFVIFNLIQPDVFVTNAPPAGTGHQLAMTQGKDLKGTARSGLEGGPVQLTLLLGTREKDRPLPPSNVIPVTSGGRPKGTGTGELGSDSIRKNRKRWILDEPLEDMDRLFDNKSPDLLSQDDFISKFNKIISLSEGSLLSKESKKGTDDLQYITLEIPAVNYRPFLHRINRLGSLQTPAPELSDDQKGMVQLRIRIIH